MKYMSKENGLLIKWVLMQHIFIPFEYLYEIFIRDIALYTLKQTLITYDIRFLLNVDISWEKQNQNLKTKIAN